MEIILYVTLYLQKLIKAACQIKQIKVLWSTRNYILSL